jgi:hypothetical protein
VLHGIIQHDLYHTGVEVVPSCVADRGRLAWSSQPPFSPSGPLNSRCCIVDGIPMPMVRW